MQQVWFLTREFQSQRKGRTLPIDLGAVAGQHTVAAQQLEQFARQRGLEVADHAIRYRHPFGVRAGQAEQMTALGQLRTQMQGAENLGLLAAQDIRRAGFAAAGKARQDGDGTALRFKPQG